jgi:hypothetical protein
MRALERFADVPWGIIVFLLVAFGGLVAVIALPDRVSVGEYLGSVSVGAGLHGVGHGIRTHRRVDANSGRGL